jgi:hypothetical protein
MNKKNLECNFTAIDEAKQSLVSAACDFILKYGFQDQDVMVIKDNLTANNWIYETKYLTTSDNGLSLSAVTKHNKIIPIVENGLLLDNNYLSVLLNVAHHIKESIKFCDLKPDSIFFGYDMTDLKLCKFVVTKTDTNSLHINLLSPLSSDDDDVKGKDVALNIYQLNETVSTIVVKNNVYMNGDTWKFFTIREEALYYLERQCKLKLDEMKRKMGELERTILACEND